MVAAPQPPSLKLPEPVTDLQAQRTGNLVALHWTMPRRTTDKVLLVGDQKAQVCRQLQTGQCVKVGTALFAPESTATFTDSLPAELTSGSPRLLTYKVDLLNRSGRSAGPSNPAITVAGAVPLPISGLRAQAQPEGILLSWTRQDTQQKTVTTIRIHRTLIEKSNPKSTTHKSTLPAKQVLEFSGSDKGRVLDSDAALDHTYAYTVQRVAKLTLQGTSVELDGDLSQTVTIDARDVFPPATPRGLQAVADPEGHAIDLSWQPNIESDLTGYTVYRHEAGAPPVRISPPAQAAPSFRDTTPQPGHTYAYSVSAVDRDRNESPRSAEVEETLPRQ